MSPLPPQTHPSTNNFPDKPVSAPETTQFKKRYYDSHQKRSPLRTAISGAFAGGLAKTIVAPIERIKLLMQLQSSLPQEYTKKKSLQIASNIYRSQGLWAFWKGNMANLWNHAGTFGLNFFFMDYYKEVSYRYCRGERDTTSASHAVLASLMSGGLAGVTATTVLYPIQFLRTRLATDVSSSTTTNNRSWSIIRYTLQSDGIRGLYQGYGISIAGVFLYRSLHLGGYDAIKTIYLDKNNQKGVGVVTTTSITWMHRIAVAQLVSFVAGTICYPIDSVRRRLMMQVGSKGPKLYCNARHAFRVIFAQEGIRGFYLGLGPNLVRSAGNALVLVTYDAVKETIS